MNAATMNMSRNAIQTEHDKLSRARDAVRGVARHSVLVSNDRKALDEAGRQRRASIDARMGRGPKGHHVSDELLTVVRKVARNVERKSSNAADKNLSLDMSFNGDTYTQHRSVLKAAQAAVRIRRGSLSEDGSGEGEDEQKTQVMNPTEQLDKPHRASVRNGHMSTSMWSSSSESESSDKDGGSREMKKREAVIRIASAALEGGSVHSVESDDENGIPLEQLSKSARLHNPSLDKSRSAAHILPEEKSNGNWENGLQLVSGSNGHHNGGEVLHPEVTAAIKSIGSGACDDEVDDDGNQLLGIFSKFKKKTNKVHPVQTDSLKESAVEESPAFLARQRSGTLKRGKSNKMFVSEAGDVGAAQKDNKKLGKRSTKILQLHRGKSMLIGDDSKNSVDYDEEEDDELEQWIAERNRAIAREQGRTVPEAVKRDRSKFGTVEEAWVESSDDEEGVAEKSDRKRMMLFPKRRYFPLHPDCTFRRLWELVNLAFILYSSVVIPYRLAFDVRAADGWYYFEWIVDVFFWVDIIVNFITAYKSYGRIVGNMRKIARNYAKSWFALDFVASFPYDLLVDALNESSTTLGTSLQLLQLLKALRLVRLVRLVRLLKMNQLFKKLEDVLTFSAPLKFLKLLVIMFLVAHLDACLWYAASSIHSHDENTWVFRYYQDNMIGGAMDAQNPGDDVDIALANRFYMYSLYFAFATMATVGYGDIIPGSHEEEHIACIVSMCIGTSVFAYLVGSMASLATSVDNQEMQYQARRSALKEYLKLKKIPKGLRRRIKEFAEYRWSKTVFGEASILQDLSWPLRQELSSFTNVELTKRVPIFRDAPPSLIMDFVGVMQPLYFSAKDVIYRKGDVGREVFLLLAGRVEVLSCRRKRPVTILHTGDMFGEECLFFSGERPVTARALSLVELYQIERGPMQDLFLDYEKTYQTIETRSIVRMMIYSRLRELTPELDTQVKLLYEDRFFNASAVLSKYFTAWWKFSVLSEMRWK
uniref:Cyclic nucleotide-binding domain-containing protein n=3 Tax=Palpitomonas bilix TaxID=652834 RepID=A0A7S3CWV8_9EUKA|mmetsp:Transcript_11228/g.29629  ORF Transcript_11228/g.29629 Transcript_11228/m.29629 type:complete len:988 (+) Transcript_11228:349-3312(+)